LVEPLPFEPDVGPLEGDSVGALPADVVGPLVPSTVGAEEAVLLVEVW
jgi:hypothetical protein